MAIRAIPAHGASWDGWAGDIDTAARGLRAEAYSDFTGLSNGTPPTRLDTGQTLAYAGGEAATILAGELTGSPSGIGQQAMYAEAQLAANVTRIGGEFTLHGAGANGLVTLVVWHDSIAVGYPLGQIPDGAVHFSISPTDWTFGIYHAGAVPIARGTFATPLDTTTPLPYRVDITVDPDTSTGRVTLPDGTTHAVTDSRISSYLGRFACWEVFQGSGTSSARAGFRKVWADSTIRPHDATATSTRRVQQMLTVPPAVQAVTWSPATPQAIVATGTSAEISTALRLNFDVPDGVTFLLQASADVYTDGAGGLYWEFLLGNPTNGPAIASLLVTNSLPLNGPVAVRAVIPQGAGGLTRVPGERQTIYWRQFITAGVGRVEAAGGLGKVATLSVQPVTGTVVVTP